MNSTIKLVRNMKALSRGLIFVFIFLMSADIQAQDTASTCKMLMEAIKGEYTGECKKGFAHGKGESKGLLRYTGSFKNGLPSGKGICMQLLISLMAISWMG